MMMYYKRNSNRVMTMPNSIVSEIPYSMYIIIVLPHFEEREKRDASTDNV
jgi:hypothetical protein